MAAVPAASVGAGPAAASVAELVPAADGPAASVAGKAASVAGKASAADGPAASVAGKAASVAGKAASVAGKASAAGGPAASVAAGPAASVAGKAASVAGKASAALVAGMPGQLPIRLQPSAIAELLKWHIKGEALDVGPAAVTLMQHQRLVPTTDQSVRVMQALNVLFWGVLFSGAGSNDALVAAAAQFRCACVKVRSHALRGADAEASSGPSSSQSSACTTSSVLTSSTASEAAAAVEVASSTTPRVKVAAVNTGGKRARAASVARQGTPGRRAASVARQGAKAASVARQGPRATGAALVAHHGPVAAASKAAAAVKATAVAAKGKAKAKTKASAKSTSNAWQEYMRLRLQHEDIQALPNVRERMKAIADEWKAHRPAHCSKCRDKGCAKCGRLKTAPEASKPGPRGPRKRFQ